MATTHMEIAEKILVSEGVGGEDARAAVPDQQMRVATSRYPVDRYLVESSNKINMVNIIDDELWNPVPTLRPEDEIALRKLHDMLQSTADDLKLLSGELAKYHEPGVQVKTQPMPLDEDFNEKVHIQELVNAKFHNYKMVDHPSPVDSNASKLFAHSKPNVNTGVQVDSVPLVKNKKPIKTKNLDITRTRIIEIEEKIDKGTNQKLNNGKIINAPAVAYNEFTFKHVEPKVVNTLQNKLKIQDMPSINIRSELREQNVLQLDIYPDNKESIQNMNTKSNVTVIATKHEAVTTKRDDRITLTKEPAQITMQSQTHIIKQPIRKVAKLSTCESSGSTNNVSSDTQHKIRTQKQIKSVIRLSPKLSARDSKTKKTNLLKRESEKSAHMNIEEWKRKLNSVYGQPSTSKAKKPLTKPPKKTVNIKPANRSLNNAEYIPYSQLTLGGVRVSDIEKEISDLPNKNNIPLSPILDKILSSRENSFHKDSPRKSKTNESPRFFTTSDENLLQEVIDIEKTVNKTIEKNKKKLNKHEEKLQPVSSESKENDEKDSYADDFEDDKSDGSRKYEKKGDSKNSYSDEPGSNLNSDDEDVDTSDNDSGSDINNKPSPKQTQSIHNKTYTKKSNLSIKNAVDVFEFVHSVDTQDNATQSNTTHKISLKETQTSPRIDNPSIHPIHNDLWPLDPKGEVEKMFKLEKDFIKKLIIDEYGEFLEKNITKPSTSQGNLEERHRNVAAFQKITQTSPAHVKSVMTSPTQTKTRTTSPFLAVAVDHQTSPLIVVTNEEHLTVEFDNEEDGISINLSSPRFSLRLPQTSREVLSNLEGASHTPSKVDVKDNILKSRTFRKDTISSFSTDVGNSSDMSSLGEIKTKLKRRLKKRILSISESSESSSTSDLPSGGIIPMKSEGELSLGQSVRRNLKNSKSEGEASLVKSK